MGTNRQSVDIDALLAERDAVQRLALQLVGDPHRADDLTQEAMLVGLEQGQRARVGIGAWLQGVTRTLAKRSGRTHVRRRRREERAARPERIPATDELVLRTREQRRVLAHLEALDEPYRTVVLLRYFEDLPPRRIADELGVPVATVKSRLYRGLTRLRAQLDEDHGGQRAGWALALVPSALSTGELASATAAVTGGLLMGTKATIVTGAAVTLLAVGAWWSLRDDPIGAGSPHDGAPPRPLSVDAETVAGLEGRHVPSEAVNPESSRQNTEADAGMVEAVGRWRGRVVDEKRRPMPGAEVIVRWKGRVLRRLTTDEHGRYVIREALSLPAEVDLFSGVQAVPSMSVWATTSDGRAGHARLFPSVRMSGLAWPLDPIVVAKAVPPSARVVAKGTPIPGAEVSLVYGGGPIRGQQIHAATVTTDADGVATFPRLPDGTGSLYAIARGFGPAVITSHLPAGPARRLAIELPALRWKTVRVVEAETSTPIDGALVRMSVRAPDRGPSWPEFAPFGGVEPTDEQGRTRVPMFAAGIEVWLQAVSRRHPIQRSGPGRTVKLDPDAEEILIELPAPTEHRWELKPGEGKLPAEGTTVRLLDARTTLSVPGYAVPSEGHIEAGFLVVRGLVPVPGLDLGLLAVLPDGRAAHAEIPRDEDVGLPIAFVRPRKLTIRVVDAHEEPVPGALFTIQGQPQALRSAIRGRTDESGVCVLEPLLPLPMKIRMYGFFQQVSMTWNEVDLTDGDQEIKLRLAPRRALRVRIHIDGKPALPAAWALKLELWSHVNPALAREDPDTGEIHVDVHSVAPLVGMQAVLEVPGLPPATGTIRAGEGGATVLLELESRGTLRARVLPPSDGRYELVLQRWAPEYAYWHSFIRSGGKQDLGEHRFGFRVLSAGRWRVRDELSGVHSEPVDLLPADGAREVVLDLRDTGIATGRVQVPKGTDMAHVRVLRSGVGTAGARPPAVQMVGPDTPAPPPFAEPPGSIKIRADGSFTLRLNGRDDLTLRAWHPTLTAEAPVVVRAPQDGLTLRLRAGPTTRITVAKGLDPADTQRIAYRVLLFDAEGELVTTCYPARAGTTLRFAGYKPGRYDIWLDGGSLAPTVLPGVALGDGETRLDEVVFGRGSTLKVTVLVAKGIRMPFLRLRAEALGEPHYIRSTMGRGPTATLQGLGAGRFKVMVRDVMQGAKILHESEIEVDGKSTQKITIDLR